VDFILYEGDVGTEMYFIETGGVQMVTFRFRQLAPDLRGRRRLAQGLHHGPGGRGPRAAAAAARQRATGPTSGGAHRVRIAAHC
jgi:hypothetical protein